MSCTDTEVLYAFGHTAKEVQVTVMQGAVNDSNLLKIRAADWTTLARLGSIVKLWLIPIFKWRDTIDLDAAKLWKAFHELQKLEGGSLEALGYEAVRGDAERHKRLGLPHQQFNQSVTLETVKSSYLHMPHILTELEDAKVRSCAFERIGVLNVPNGELKLFDKRSYPGVCR